MSRSQSVALQPKILGIPPPPPKKLEILSYPHTIDWGTLTNVWLWFVYWK